MKRLFFLFIAVFLSQYSYSQSLKDFKWMVGSWERQNTRPGTTAFESWKKTKEGYKGMGVSTKEADTSFVEKLRIIEKEGAIYYVADVSSNAEPTYFKVTSVSKNGFVCENPEHDFPKKIEYTLEGNQMTAVISAGEQKMGFVFKKVE
ncbi:MAG: DUF6265 family protein [Ekhidna sp.]|uniref:DUF6265 family protein n=1 Tax=Ekhidna sp. TaxID=2608089 RepID=UPI0032EFA89B